jgi:hypothetical protein
MQQSYGDATHMLSGQGSTMRPPNTVIERGLGGPICGECQNVLAVSGPHNRICLHCHSHLAFSELLDERELAILKEGMVKYDMSAKAVIKKWLRLGQMADLFVAQGYEMVFRLGDNEVDPFDRGPKMAPMPACGGVDCKVLQPGMTYHNLDTCPEKKPAPGMHDGWENSPFNREREEL